ncbi:MAG: hypothetical protein ACLQBD_22625 [Syntrophobacteraceae bacterium]
MARKKKPEPDDPEQSAKFIEAAQKIELVENPKEAFEEALKEIGKAKRQTPLKKPDSE